ncbi:MAG: Cell division protein ZapD [Nitrosomonadaceae bacterium]|nr:Cell division protein ZapD [Nitrosomonadaceae bacterium]
MRNYSRLHKNTLKSHGTNTDGPRTLYVWPQFQKILWSPETHDSTVLFARRQIHSIGGRFGKTFRHKSVNGTFQQTQTGLRNVAHMLQLKLEDDLPCVPEISANKYALNIRFVVSSSKQKTKVYEGDFEFELTFCNL